MKALPCRRDAACSLLTLGLIALAGVETLGQQRAPLCPSVLMFDEASWQHAPERVSRVADLLADAAPDARWVQLVPTVHVELNEDLTVKRFGLRRKHHASWESPDNFVAAADAQTFSTHLTGQLEATIKQALFRGLNVAIVPHIDAAGAVQEWRNHIDFDPRQVHEGLSYETTLLEPIVFAIEQASSTNQRVDLALSGEMGRSWFAYPVSYAKLLDRFHERFRSNPRTANVRLGVASNWNGVAGQLKPQDVDRQAVRDLFARCDFVGFSCYAPMSVPPAAEDFRTAVLNTRRELATYGAELAQQPVVMSEVGIGGGGRELRQLSGADASRKVAAEPWRGVGSGYNPWREEALGRLREQFHAALCEYLASSNGLSCVERAFLWSEGPWDPQGVTEGGLRDEAIARRISDHNSN